MTEGLMEVWTRLRALVSLGNAVQNDAFDWTEAEDLERHVLCAPISTTDDVVAKLSAVRLVFDDGPRNDDLDRSALDQAIGWLTTRNQFA